MIASGIGGFPTIVETTRIVDAKGARRLSPFTVPSFLVNLAAGHVSIRHGFEGAIGAPVTACAASAQAIGDAMRLIRSGEADVVLAGGTEACIDRVSLAGFAAARAPFQRLSNDAPATGLATLRSRPQRICHGRGRGGAGHRAARSRAGAWRPADRRTGRLWHDRGRLSCDWAGPEDGGAGAKLRAMRLALDMAGARPDEIGYVNAHATSTPVGDAGELAALKSLFGVGGGPAISSTKSATGHLLGAAGAMEAMFTVLALRDGLLPPTLNLDNPDPAAEGLDLIGPQARRAKVDLALSNGFGFGGVNAAILLRRWDA